MIDWSAEQDDRFKTWWSWFAVALYVLLTVDMLTTMGIIVEMGVGVETNPVMRYLYGRGTVVVMVVNLGALLIATACFRSVVALTRRLASPWDRYFGITVEIWLGLLVAMGLFIFANNMAVIVLGKSLL